MRSHRLPGLAGAAALAASCVLVGGAGAAAGAADSAATSVCGSMAGQQPHITKVLWIFMENQSYGTGPGEIPGSASDPYIRRTLTAHCGSTSDYHAVTHPSYPNYLAATSGSTQGMVTGGLHYFDVNSIFGQVDPSWRSYQEFMPVNCDHVALTGSPATDQYYDGGHNPAVSYSKLPVGAPKAGDCSKYDEPLGSARSGHLVHDVRTGTLPSFGFITPGLCDDMHKLPPGVAGCPNPVASGDAWLAKWIPIITAGPDYAGGHLVIDITWDEGSGGSLGADCLTSAALNCLVADIVISPYTRHVLSGTDFSHYSLLKMTETLLHVPYLGAAGRPGTKNLCVPFGLCPSAR